MEKGFSAPVWMTFKQALELGAHVRKGEKGSLVVYADTITRTESTENGEEREAVIPFMKGYTVFNVEQIETCRRNIMRARKRRSLIRRSASSGRKASSPRREQPSRMAAQWPVMRSSPIISGCRLSRLSATRRATTPRSRMNAAIGPSTPRV